MAFHDKPARRLAEMKTGFRVPNRPRKRQSAVTSDWLGGCSRTHQDNYTSSLCPGSRPWQCAKDLVSRKRRLTQASARAQKAMLCQGLYFTFCSQSRTAPGSPQMPRGCRIMLVKRLTLENCTSAGDTRPNIPAPPCRVSALGSLDNSLGRTTLTTRVLTPPSSLSKGIKVPVLDPVTEGRNVGAVDRGASARASRKRPSKSRHCNEATMY